jgi:2'-5' RNA ligase
MTPSRLFFALLPPEPARVACEKAARDLVIKMAPGGRSVPPSKYHITLAFLGNQLDADQQFNAIQAARQITAEPFDLRLDIASCFEKSKVWWLGARETPAGLAKLRSDLSKRLLAAGFELDRLPFAPHVTVQYTAAKLAKTPLRPIEWKATEFVLMRSTLLPGESAYEEIERWPLRGAPEQKSLL